jgi:hypothetical protein
MVAVASTIREMRYPSESTHHHHLMIAGLDRVGQCLGLPGHQSKHQWTSSFGGHIKALIYTSLVDSEENLITNIVETAATIRQVTWLF